MTPTPPYIGAIDQGTTGTRFVVFDVTGTPIGDGFVAHERSVQPPNRIEYDATEIWQCTRAAIQEGMDRAGIAHNELAAIGIANQRQTTVVWDTDGTPVAPAQSWQDRRTTRMLADMDAETRSMIEDRTGLIVDPYFAGPKLAWLLEHETYRGRSLRAAAEAGHLSFGTVDSWLVSRLTGEHRTDVTNASQSLLFSHESCDWDEELLDIFDIPPAVLPQIAPSGDPSSFGRTDVDGLLGTEIPVTGVIGNQQSALVGQAGFDTGSTKVSYGSGNFALQHVGERLDPDGSSLLSTIWFQLAGEEPEYGLEGPVLTTGSALEWLERIGLLADHDRLVTSTDPAPHLGQPVVIPTIGGGSALDWTGGNGGTIAQLSRFTERDDIVRGMVDGIGFITRAVLDLIERRSGMDSSPVFVDGGAMTDDAFARRQASLLGRRLIRSDVTQTSALGASFTAGLASGIWSDRADVAQVWSENRQIDPGDQDAVTDRYQEWSRIASTVLANESSGTIDP